MQLPRFHPVRWRPCGFGRSLDNAQHDGLAINAARPELVSDERAPGRGTPRTVSRVGLAISPFAGVRCAAATGLCSYHHVAAGIVRLPASRTRHGTVKAVGRRLPTTRECLRAPAGVGRCGAGDRLIAERPDPSGLPRPTATRRTASRTGGLPSQVSGGSRVSPSRHNTLTALVAGRSPAEDNDRGREDLGSSGRRPDCGWACGKAVEDAAAPGPGQPRRSTRQPTGNADVHRLVTLDN